jgi:hypothetical protein
MLLLLVGCGSKTSDSPITDQPHFSTYENQSLHIKVNYPAGWIKIEQTAGTWTAMGFVAPDKSGSFSLQVDTDQVSFNLDAFLKATKDQMTSIESVEKTELAKSPAYKIVGTVILNNIERKEILYITIINQRIHRLSFYAANNKFADFADEFAQITASFEITTPTGLKQQLLDLLNRKLF